MSLSIPEDFSDSAAMKNPITTICLTCAVLLSLSVNAWSADYQKGYAAYKSDDYATALREWTPLAEQGIAAAQFFLGLMYRNGHGVTQDYKTAIKWYTLAAQQGFAAAQYNLSVMYDSGQGVIQDNVYAHMWYNIAASQGGKVAGENRNKLAAKMSATQTEKAQDLARKCVKKKFKGC